MRQKVTFTGRARKVFKELDMLTTDLNDKNEKLAEMVK